jgi:hypothetical protein
LTLAILDRALCLISASHGEHALGGVAFRVRTTRLQIGHRAMTNLPVLRAPVGGGTLIPFRDECIAELARAPW